MTDTSDSCGALRQYALGSADSVDGVCEAMGLTLPRDTHAAAATLDVGELSASRERASVRPYADARAGK